ncbi:MAG: PDZ domain-containing protein [Planctomycetota bacterium]|jgi:C-terminal processing protease CtpA/Prc
MRILAIALLLGVPLSAADEPSLEEAVRLFRSPDAARRQAASQLVDRELRRLLAPLLEAMEDRDPEVRRRARRSILSLVPGEAEKEEQANARAPTQAAVLALLRQRQVRAQQNWAGLLQRIQLRQADAARAARLVAELGIRGRTDIRPPLMPGFRVEHVKKASPAARLGLRAGDLIVRVNGRAVVRMHDFAGALGDKPAWSRVTITVLRNGRYLRLAQQPGATPPKKRNGR